MSVQPEGDTGLKYTVALQFLGIIQSSRVTLRSLEGFVLAKTLLEISNSNKNNFNITNINNTGRG